MTEIDKKRRLSNLDDDLDKKKVKVKKPKNEIMYLFLEVQVTGYTSEEDIIKLSIIDQNNSNSVNGFVIPQKRLMEKISSAINIDIEDQIISFDDIVHDTQKIETLLDKFVNYLESKQNDNLILVYENQLNLGYIVHILIKKLCEYKLIDRVECLVTGFIDCNLLFNYENEFDDEFLLDVHASNLNIKSELPSIHPLYRLDLLQKYFYSKLDIVLSKQDEIIVNFEKAKNEIANHYYS